MFFFVNFYFYDTLKESIFSSNSFIFSIILNNTLKNSQNIADLGITNGREKEYLKKNTL